MPRYLSMIRIDEAADWAPVPQGFRVVWREFGRADAAASVAQRMHRLAPPRRRAPRNARPAPRRDPRGRPLAGATSMVVMLGMMAGPLVAGILADRTGSYRSGFTLLATLALLTG